jgi:hypothetical protein
MRVVGIFALAIASLGLQGCVALVLPVAAAGLIGKKEIDKARARARAAEASFDPSLPPQVIVGDGAADNAADNVVAAVPTPPDGADAPPALSALDRLDRSGITNAYLPFARYAIGEAGRQRGGLNVRGAVLVDQVSLTYPKAIGCDNKPVAVIIDLDVAPGTPAEMEVERQTGFAALLEAMRESGIRIAWLAEANERRLKPVLDLLREGEEPVIRDADMMLVGLPGDYRKQDLRWQLAQSHCVVAIAGDRKGDFDELYDYLRDQSYAIRLEAFMGKGWFELPHPVSAIDSEKLEIAPEKKADQ